MTHFFTDTFKAFDPFFDEQIEIVHNGNSKIVLSSVFPIEEQDPFDETSVDSDLRTLNMVIGHENGLEVEVGDSVTYENKKYSVVDSQ